MFHVDEADAFGFSLDSVFPFKLALIYLFKGQRQKPNLKHQMRHNDKGLFFFPLFGFSIEKELLLDGF